MLEYKTRRLGNPPQTTAISWSLISGTGEELASKHPTTKLEIASLTKIMTAYAALSTCEELNLNLDLVIQVPKLATLMGGTSAFLRRDDTLSLLDLLYGLMLPSGNDAAITIAMGLGKQINAHRKGRQPSQPFYNTMSGFQSDTAVNHIYRFVKHMNECAARLGMRDTQFSNPHGLSCKANKSTANDICKLSLAYLKYPILSQICDTKSHQCKIYHWYNTNQLLFQSNYHGIKTGITPTAGACLAVVNESDMGQLILVLIGAKDQIRRFDETDKLINWITKEYGVQTCKSMFQPPRSAYSKSRSVVKKYQ